MKSKHKRTHKSSQEKYSTGIKKLELNSTTEFKKKKVHKGSQKFQNNSPKKNKIQMGTQKSGIEKSQINVNNLVTKKKTHCSTIKCNNEAQPKQSNSLLANEESSKGQYIIAKNSECTSEKQLKRKSKGNLYINPDSNWKALLETLPKAECSGAKYHKRKKLKLESPTNENVLRSDGRRNETGDDVWFDDVDPSLLESSGDVKQKNNPIALVNEDGQDGLTKHVAVDCEMVGVGYKGQDSILARVSIVNEFGKCVYDKYVKPREKVTDFRTAVSGIKPHHIHSGAEFKDVQREVADMFKDRIIVGHALSNDLKVLFLGHPRKKVRDTSEYKPFRRLNKGSKPSLKKLAELVLHRSIQDGEHDSVEDARVAMKLYMLNKKEWEKSIKLKSKGVIKQSRPLHANDSQSIKDEKRRKIKLFKLRNAQKKRRR